MKPVAFNLGFANFSESCVTGTTYQVNIHGTGCAKETSISCMCGTKCNVIYNYDDVCMLKYRAYVSKITDDAAMIYMGYVVHSEMVADPLTISTNFTMINSLGPFFENGSISEYTVTLCTNKYDDAVCKTTTGKVLGEFNTDVTKYVEGPQPPNVCFFGHDGAKKVQAAPAASKVIDKDGTKVDFATAYGCVFVKSSLFPVEISVTATVEDAEETGFFKLDYQYHSTIRIFLSPNPSTLLEVQIYIQDYLNELINGLTVSSEGFVGKVFRDSRVMFTTTCTTGKSYDIQIKGIGCAQDRNITCQCGSPCQPLFTRQQACPKIFAAHVAEVTDDAGMPHLGRKIHTELLYDPAYVNAGFNKLGDLRPLFENGSISKYTVTVCTDDMLDPKCVLTSASKLGEHNTAVTTYKEGKAPPTVMFYPYFEGKSLFAAASKGGATLTAKGLTLHFHTAYGATYIKWEEFIANVSIELYIDGKPYSGSAAFEQKVDEAVRITLTQGPPGPPVNPGLGTGAVVGISVGAIVVVVALVAAVVCCCRRRSSHTAYIKAPMDVM